MAVTLAGVELRKAVARIIGFDVTPCEDGGEQGWWISTPKDGHFDFDPVNGWWHTTEESAWGDILDYEENAALLPEMWTQIEAAGLWPMLCRDKDGRFRAVALRISSGEGVLLPGCDGQETGAVALTEFDAHNMVTAFARLRVAVAEWQKQQG